MSIRKGGTSGKKGKNWDNDAFDTGFSTDFQGFNESAPEPYFPKNGKNKSFFERGNTAPTSFFSEYQEPVETDEEFLSSFMDRQGSNNSFGRQGGFGGNGGYNQGFGGNQSYGNVWGGGRSNGRTSKQVFRENVLIKDQVVNTVKDVLGFSSSGAVRGRGREGAMGVVQREVNGYRQVIKGILNDFKLW